MNRLSIRNLVTRSSLLMAMRVVGAAISFAGSVLVARHFGADVLGHVALSMAAMALLAQFVCGGRQAVAPLFVSEYQVRNRPELVRGFIKSGHRAIAASSLISIVILVLVTLVFDNVLSTELSGAFVFAGLSAVPIALINFNGGVLTGYRRPVFGLAPDLLIKPLLVLFVILGAVVLIPAATSYAILAGICCALWTTAALQAFVIRWRNPIPGESADESDSGRWRQTATPWIAIILLADYLVELHLLLAGWLLSPALVGVLHVCFRLRMLASFGMRALYSVILPDVYAAHASGESTLVASGISRGNALVLAYTVLTCAVVVVFGKWILGLFGSEFEAGYQALVIVCLSMIPRAIFGPATAIMAAAGRQKPMILVLIAGIAVSAATILATYSVLGFQSFAIGYATSVTFVALAQWLWALHATGIDCSIFAAATCRLKTSSPLIPRLQFSRY